MLPIKRRRRQLFAKVSYAAFSENMVTATVLVRLPPTRARTAAAGACRRLHLYGLEVVVVGCAALWWCRFGGVWVLFVWSVLVFVCAFVPFVFLKKGTNKKEGTEGNIIARRARRGTLTTCPSTTCRPGALQGADRGVRRVEVREEELCLWPSRLAALRRLRVSCRVSQPGKVLQDCHRDVVEKVSNATITTSTWRCSPEAEHGLISGQRSRGR